MSDRLRINFENIQHQKHYGIFNVFLKTARVFIIILNIYISHLKYYLPWVLKNYVMHSNGSKALSSQAEM